MKTFRQFQKDLQEAIPLALPAAGLALPIIGGAAKLAQSYMQARRQGQGARSQPVDYGQGGETKARTPNVQRPSGKVTAAEAQKRQAAADRRAEAQRRAEEKAKEGIDWLIGTDAERAAAAKARANPESQRSAALKRTVAQRMSKAADKLKLPEQMTAPKLMNRNMLDLRTTKEKQREIEIPAKLLPYNPEIGDAYKTSKLKTNKNSPSV